MEKKVEKELALHSSKTIELADPVKFIDKKNQDFYKKIIKKNRIEKCMEWCNGCDLYVYKIHLCPVVGVWINIDSYHLHFIIGSREEDVRRTSNQDGVDYKVYFFNKR